MPTEVQAAVLHQVGEPLEIETVEIDDPAPDEIRVELVGSGLCHSDLHVMGGYLPAVSLPAVLGHEAAGVVVEVGSQIQDVNIGDHVVAGINTHCGHCHYGSSGRTWICERRLAPGIRSDPMTKVRLGNTAVSGIGGMSGFAEQVILHKSAAVVIDPDMPLDRAALIGCALVTGVGTVINAARVRPGETCVVIGCGGVGLNVVQGARLAGAGRIIAVDLQASKLELATRFGATDLVDAGDGDPVEAVLGLTGGRGVDHAFEAIGIKPTSEQALAMASAGGGAYLIGVVPPGVNLEVPGLEFVLNNKTLCGVKLGSSNMADDFPYFVDLYQQGRLMIDELIAERITLSEINEGYDRMRAGDQARSVIVFH